MSLEPLPSPGRALEVVIELGDALTGIAAAHELSDQLERTVAADVNGTLERLGLIRGCTVRVEHATGDGLLGIQLGGRRLAYPTTLAAELWQSFFDDEAVDEGAIARALAERIAPADAKGVRDSLQFVAALAAEILKLRPERLLRDPDVKLLARRLRSRPGQHVALEAAHLRAVVHSLLALGLRAGAEGGNAPLVETLSELDRPPDVPHAYASKRSPSASFRRCGSRRSRCA